MHLCGRVVLGFEPRALCMLGMCLTTGHAPHPQMLISEVVWATGALPTPDLPELVETGIWLHSLGAHHMLLTQRPPAKYQVEHLTPGLECPGAHGDMEAVLILTHDHVCPVLSQVPSGPYSIPFLQHPSKESLRYISHS